MTGGSSLEELKKRKKLSGPGRISIVYNEKHNPKLDPKHKQHDPVLSFLSQGDNHECTRYRSPRAWVTTEGAMLNDPPVYNQICFSPQWLHIYSINRANYHLPRIHLPHFHLNLFELEKMPPFGGDLKNLKSDNVNQTMLDIYNVYSTSEVDINSDLLQTKVGCAVNS